MMPVKGYITDFETLEYIEFDFFDPITEEVSANFPEQAVRGRSEPYVFYEGTNLPSTNWVLTIAASTEQGDAGTEEEAWAKAQFIQSFVYPDYDSPNFTRSPHLAIINVGRYFNEKVRIKSVQIERSNVLSDRERPLLLKVSFGVDIVFDKPFGYKDVRNRRY